jgi:hypothetical protein
MEWWNGEIGMMEYWNIERIGLTIAARFFHYSNVPGFHYSIS